MPDTDAKTCGQCRHWNFYGQCGQCEDDYECKRMDRAMLEDKRSDGYFKRACASALLHQVRRQNMAQKGGL